jgi:hypothetical protein
MLNTDSRQYRFAFELQSKFDIPADFPALLSENGWRAALFMPGDTDTFWQPPEYSPRIYLLKDDSLLIYCHPTSSEKSFQAPLNSLMAVELQKSLLYGVVQFHTGTASERFRYSTVHQRLFNRFLHHLRSQWLISTELTLPAVAIEPAVQHSSVRCLRELSGELDPDEFVYQEYCQPAFQAKERTWFFRRSHTAPALLIAVTNRRIIAISTGVGERNDSYEMAVRYAPASGLSTVDVANGTSGSVILQIQLKNHIAWRFRLSVAQSPPVLSLLAAVRNLAPAPCDDELES